MGNSLGEIPTCFSPPVQPYVSSLPTSLSLQIELSDTLVGATMLVAKAKFDLTDHVGVAAFERVLQNHSKELETCRSRQSTSLTAMDRLYLSISRLILHTLHFFKSPSEKHFHAWRYPFDDACALIHGLHDLEKSMHIDLYGPSFVYHGVLLAACTILRCLKTPFADTIGRESSTAQALFFSAINMIRNISIVEGDKAAKSAWALQHLWRSDTVYKRSNGSWDLDLRVKGRFSSSVIYDTMWWSRSEFIGQTNGYSMKKSGPRESYSIRFSHAGGMETDLRVVTAPGTAWSNSEADRFTADNSGFEPDLFADMVFTQDWILSDWEVSSSTMNSNHVPEAVPSAHALQ